MLQLSGLYLAQMTQNEVYKRILVTSPLVYVCPPRKMWYVLYLRLCKKSTTVTVV